MKNAIILAMIFGSFTLTGCLEEECVTCTLNSNPSNKNDICKDDYGSDEDYEAEIELAESSGFSCL